MQDNTRAQSDRTTGGMTAPQKRILAALAACRDEEQAAVLCWRSGARHSGHRVLSALIYR